jgi:hypothetical protein
MAQKAFQSNAPYNKAECTALGTISKEDTRLE